MKKAVVIIMVIMLVAVVAVIGVGCNNGWNLLPDKDNDSISDLVGNGGYFPKGNGMVIAPVTETNQMCVTAQMLSAGDTDENYGVFTQSESSYFLTATVYPETATDKSVTWMIAWNNASSTWATGKTVTDYVTIMPASEVEATATVACIQPFGEKIIITATSRDNPSVSANCIVDYSQKIESASLKFGVLPVNLNGGTTEFKYEVSPDCAGCGGAVNVTFSKSSVYTLVDNFTYNVDVKFLSQDFKPLDTALNFRTLTMNGLDFVGVIRDSVTEYKFDRNDVNNLHHESRKTSELVYFNSLTTDKIIEYFSALTEGYCGAVVLTVSGTYSSYESYSILKCTGYTNHSPVTQVDLTSSYIF